jgi:hypothetical protein
MNPKDRTRKKSFFPRRNSGASNDLPKRLELSGGLKIEKDSFNTRAKHLELFW